MNFDQPYPRLPLRADRSVQGDHSLATGAGTVPKSIMPDWLPNLTVNLRFNSWMTHGKWWQGEAQDMSTRMAA
jgi:hypothetical protein